jgi:membrane protein implicated in regulation of membrane protease activity
MKTAILAIAVFVAAFLLLALVTSPLGWVGGYEAVILAFAAALLTWAFVRRRRGTNRVPAGPTDQTR